MAQNQMNQNIVEYPRIEPCTPLTVDISPILELLRQDAPLSTRKDINFYQGYPPRYDFQYQFWKPFSQEWDSVVLQEPEFVNIATITHELTHAYVARAFKEIRGYTKLMMKMDKNPELIEQLDPVAKELKKNITSLDDLILNGVYYDLSFIQEGMSHACESRYGELREDKHDVDTEIDACNSLIDLIDIDGARSFVRNKVRDMYVNNTLGKSIEEEVEDYKSNILAFFTNVLN